MRRSRLRPVAGMQIAVYGIPDRSLRGPYFINQDFCYIDRRCLNRYRNKWRRDMQQCYGRKVK